ncbi:hypothetical protein [Variovorax humicola]|uniref:hypothetical protein n=1 Tax=Variovorax humicola TaxID=1769758 RepID=UPI003BF5031D
MHAENSRVESARTSCAPAVEVSFYEDSFVKPFDQRIDERYFIGGTFVLLSRVGQERSAGAMHPDPWSGYDERSSQCSDKLLSMQAANTLRLMLHAREAHWKTPVTGAPHLKTRSLWCSDPLTSRARRPLIMMRRFGCFETRLRGISSGWLE